MTTEAVGDELESELRGELRLEDDHGQRVPEKVVQIARNPLALRDLRQMLDLVVREPQLRVRSRHLE